MSADPAQGAEYYAFLKDQLSREYARRDQVNARAGAAITSATALVTLSTGVFALLLGKDFKLTGAGLACMGLALFSLLCCAVFAVIAGLNRTYDAVDETTMRTLLGPDHWKDDAIDARWQTANFTLISIASLRAGTNFKYAFLTFAGIAQIAAIAALTAAAVVVLS